MTQQQSKITVYRARARIYTVVKSPGHVQDIGKL